MDKTEILNIGKTSPMAAAFVSTQEPRRPSHVFLGLMWGMKPAGKKAAAQQEPAHVGKNVRHLRYQNDPQHTHDNGRINTPRPHIRQMQGQNGKREQPDGINKGKQRSTHGTESPASIHRVLHLTDEGNHYQEDRSGKCHQKRKGDEERNLFRKGAFPEFSDAA